MKASLTICPSCGAMVDLYSRVYEQRMIAALREAKTEQRAQICWILGARGQRTATATLVDLLEDPEPSVREAALRALGEIGDPTAVPAVEKLTTAEDEGVRTAAKYVLWALGGNAVGSGHRRAS